MAVAFELGEPLVCGPLVVVLGPPGRRGVVGVVPSFGSAPCSSSSSITAMLPRIAASCNGAVRLVRVDVKPKLDQKPYRVQVVLLRGSHELVGVRGDRRARRS